MERRGGGRLIQMGSAAEYGPQAGHRPVCEAATPHPASPYALTKLMATRLVVAAIEEKRVQGTVLRVFNPVGAGAPETSLPGRAAHAIRRAMAEQRRSITLGSLQVHRDFVAATDVGTATVLAAAAADLPAILNVGRGVAMSADALLTLLEGVAGFDGQIIESERGLAPIGLGSLAAGRRDLAVETPGMGTDDPDGRGRGRLVGGGRALSVACG